MKRLILLTTALLLSLLAHSQEADSLSLTPSLNFTLRGEYSTVQDSHLGNSSLYVNLDGSFSEVMSYSAELHLLSSDPEGLYKNTWSGMYTNWLDWAFLNFKFGSVDFSLGKMAVTFNTWEYSEYDFDCMYELASIHWLTYNSYQWGGKIGWKVCDALSLDFTAATSPLAGPPFACGKYQFRLAASVTGGNLYSGLFSLHHMQGTDCYFDPLGEGPTCKTFFAMGHKFTFGRWDIRLDNINALNTKSYEGSGLLSANCYLNDKWYLGGKIGADSLSERVYGGVMAHWYPLESIRAHCLVGYDSLPKNFFFNIGLTWTIRLFK